MVSSGKYPHTSKRKMITTQTFNNNSEKARLKKKLCLSYAVLATIINGATTLLLMVKVNIYRLSRGRESI